MVKRDWSEIIGQLSIHFEDRIKLEIWRMKKIKLKALEENKADLISRESNTKFFYSLEVDNPDAAELT